MAVTNKRYDIVHTHSFYGPGIEARKLARRLKVPLVGTNHTLIESFAPGGMITRMFAAYLVRFFNRTAYVTSPSMFLLEDMRAKGLKTEGRVVSNPIADGFFMPRTQKEVLKRELDLPGFTFLNAGRLSPEKNPGVLIEAFALFAAAHADATLVMIGEGSSRRSLEARVKALHLEGRIRFLGPYMGERLSLLYDYFHAADTFVIPSTSETQSMTAMQAMAASLPVIAARAGALPEMVADSRGALFEPDDVQDLLSQLEEAYARTSGTEGVQKARAFAEAFSTKTIADTWERLYQKIVETKPYA
jgi:glycosyltransferase involved in cell wall biosynthesis